MTSLSSFLLSQILTVFRPFCYHKCWQSFALSVITNADSLSSFLLSQILTVFHPFCYHKFWQSFILSVITNSDSLSSFLLSQILTVFRPFCYHKFNIVLILTMKHILRLTCPKNSLKHEQAWTWLTSTDCKLLILQPGIIFKPFYLFIDL